MDEMQLVREVYEEPAPPTPREVAQARALITRGARRTRSPIRGRRLHFSLGGLVAVGAAAAVAIATLGNGAGTGPPGPGTGTPTARTILLAAADHAAKEPTGRYWHLKRERGQAYRVKDGYTVLGHRSQYDGWRSPSGSLPDVTYGRNLGARPLTPADEAAWKRAGSPATFRVWSNDHWDTLTTEAAPWNTDTVTPEEKRGPYGRALEERIREAEDPATLKKLLYGPPALNRLNPSPAQRLGYSTFFLTFQPVPPEIRAAAFRELANLPGVRAAGTVRDAKGRTGIALAARDTMRDGSGTVYEERLILEPKTYRILGTQKVVVKAGGPMKGMRPGDLLSHDLILELGWTNESPEKPAG